MNQFLSEPYQRECSDMVAHKDTAARKTARNRSSSYLDAPPIQHLGSEQRTTVNSNPRPCSSSMFIPGSTSSTLLVAAYELEDHQLVSGPTSFALGGYGSTHLTICACEHLTACL
jgi:hypothetical protein